MQDNNNPPKKSLSWCSFWMSCWRCCSSDSEHAEAHTKIHEKLSANTEESETKNTVPATEGSHKEDVPNVSEQKGNPDQRRHSAPTHLIPITHGNTSLSGHRSISRPLQQIPHERHHSTIPGAASINKPMPITPIKGRNSKSCSKLPTPAGTPTASQIDLSSEEKAPTGSNLQEMTSYISQKLNTVAADTQPSSTTKKSSEPVFASEIFIRKNFKFIAAVWRKLTAPRGYGAKNIVDLFSSLSLPALKMDETPTTEAFNEAFEAFSICFRTQLYPRSMVNYAEEDIDGEEMYLKFNDILDGINKNTCARVKFFLDKNSLATYLTEKYKSHPDIIPEQIDFSIKSCKMLAKYIYQIRDTNETEQRARTHCLREAVPMPQAVLKLGQKLRPAPALAPAPALTR